MLTRCNFFDSERELDRGGDGTCDGSSAIAGGRFVRIG